MSYMLLLFIQQKAHTRSFELLGAETVCGHYRLANVTYLWKLMEKTMAPEL